MSCLEEAVAALAGLDTDDMAGFHLYGGQIGGGFHQPFDVVAHADHAMRAGM